MAICPNCGAKVLPDDEVCRACGEARPVTTSTETDALDPLIGTVIAGNFEVNELIGEGAMGRVYAARQVSLDKEVAIKVLHPHLQNDPKVAKRFHREARAASRLSHPNSLQIFDFGAAKDGTLYIAMELLDGPDLLELLEDESPLSPARIGDILGQILLALDEAHHAGIIHRDLKPENVIVVESRGGHDHVKVCDFGIAKIVEAEGGSAITVTGFVCGTPEYMAPEQARGETLDKRADLYAAGCMLYQLLTGEVPFTAESALGIITKHLTMKPVPPRQRKPELHIPRGLERVCDKAMSKDRDGRYRDAIELKDAIDDVIRQLGHLAAEPLGTSREDPTGITRTESLHAAIPTGKPLRWIVPLLLVAGASIFGLLYWADEEPSAETRMPAPLHVDAAVETASAPLVSAADASVQDAAVPAPEDAGDISRQAPDAEAAPTKRRGRRVVRPRPPPRTSEVTAAMTPAPSPGRAAFDEGRRLFLGNDVPGAIRHFEEAARLMPRNAQVQKQLGRAYMRTGNVQRGVSAWRRYLELAPNAGDRAIAEAIISQHGGR